MSGKRIKVFVAKRTETNVEDESDSVVERIQSNTIIEWDVCIYFIQLVIYFKSTVLSSATGVYSFEGLHFIEGASGTYSFVV